MKLRLLTLAVLLSLSPAALAATLAVPGDYPTAAEAAEAASAGDVIRLEAGTHEGPVELPAGVTLQGAGPETTFLESNVFEGPVLTAARAKDVTVTGITVRHNGPEQAPEDAEPPMAAVLSQDSTVMVRECVVEKSPVIGLAILGGGESRVENCVFRANAQTGLGLGDGSEARVTDCVAADNGYNGVGLWGHGTETVVRDCRIEGNGRSGIYVLQHAGGAFTGNTITGNDGIGVSIEEGAGEVELVDNTLGNNGWSALWLPYESSMTGSGNTMTGNGEVQDHQLGWLLKNRDFDTIESLVDDMRARKLRYSTGEWCLRHAYDGLVGGQKDFNWKDTPGEVLDALNAWAEAKPESATPLIARAQYELNLAWESRGGGWARDVTEEGWRGFREHLGKAWEYLRKAEAMAPADPQLYTIQIHASRGFSAGAPDSLLEAFKQVLSGERPAAPYREAFEKGVAVEPRYDLLYSEMAFTLMPRWYGSVGEVMDFASASTESLEPPYDDMMYAVIADRVLHCEGQREFLESYTFSWPRIRNGLEQRAALYTNNTWTDSRLAYFAAVYRDRQLAAQLFEDLGDNADEDALGGAKRMRQLRAWALENAPMPVQNAEFLEAVRSGTRWRVEAMLDEGASPNSEGAQGETALFAAVRLQEPELVALLLEQGADPNSVGWEGWPSLFQAVKFERIDLVRMLLEHGADPDKSPLDRLSCPLVAAAAHNRADIAALLVEHGADVNIQDKDGWTPLHASAQRGFADIVTLLLDNGADVHAVAGPGLTPLYSAVHHGQTECAELLLAHGSDPNKLQWGGQFRPLTGAAWRGHLDIVRLLLAREDVDLLATSGKGHNALMMAAAAGHLDIVTYLVEEHEFPLDLRSATGQTALGAAIEMEKPAVAGYLREHGAQE